MLELKEKSKTRSRVRFQSHVMKELNPLERINAFEECMLGYDHDEAVSEARRCLSCKKACVTACPINFPVPEFMNFVANGKIEEAGALILKYTPLPQCLTRVCGEKCASACTLGKKGDPLNIAGVKRFVAEEVGIPESFFEKNYSTGKKIAIVGSGPAGFACAIDLMKFGHEVTIFEKEEVCGGMFALGIPEFRLPKSILNREYELFIEKLGIKIRTKCALGKDFTLESLLENGYDAGLLAFGSHVPRKLNMEGEDSANVLNGLDVLKQVNLGNDINLGENVGIIGGGNAAIDVARVARRLGADTTIYYRRTKNEMPANESEIEEAEKEGIKIEFLTQPVKANCNGDKLEDITFLRMKLGEPDASGRKRPVPIEGSEFNIKIDTLITAISESPDFSWLNEKCQLQESVNKWNTVDVENNDFSTSYPGVFVAGDIVSGQGLVIEAIFSGRAAATQIDRFLLA